MKLIKNWRYGQVFWRQEEDPAKVGWEFGIDITEVALPIGLICPEHKIVGIRFLFFFITRY